MRRCQRGFTLIELMVVVALIAIAIGVVSLSLRDGDSDRLDNESARLAALLESARAEARASGLGVRWLPTPDAEGRNFRFVGLPAGRKLPERWLDERVTAQVDGANALVLGPEAIIPAQRIVLRLGRAELVLATDGLAPFAVQSQATIEAPS
jgi:general secretion pathway protein H